MLTVKDVMEQYKVSQATVYNWMNRGMPFHKLGKLTRFEPAEVDKWLKNGGGTAEDARDTLD
jgi:excisionase family DNA binding protein